MEYCDGVSKRTLSAQMDARQWGDDEVRQYLWDDIDDKEWRFMSCRLNEIEWKGAMRRGWNVKLLRQDHNFLVASEIATYAMAFDNWQLGEAGATMPEFLCERWRTALIGWGAAVCYMKKEEWNFAENYTCIDWCKWASTWPCLWPCVVLWDGVRCLVMALRPWAIHLVRFNKNEIRLLPLIGAGRGGSRKAIWMMENEHCRFADWFCGLVRCVRGREMP